MSVKARFKVDSVTDYGHFKQVVMTPLTSNDVGSPNYSFSKYTPCGEVKLTITNPEAFNQFTPNKVYNIDFSEHTESTKS